MFQNNFNLPTSETIETYGYKIGLVDFRFSYATAAGLAQSTVAVTLLVVSNFFLKKTTDNGLF